MVEHKKIQERALEAMVYLPVGTAIAARDEIPKLAAKGKSYVTTQLTMARTVGNFAVAFGGREAEKQLLRAVRRLGVMWGERPASTPGAPSTAPPQANTPIPSVGPEEGATVSQPRNGNAAVPTAIVGYDSLSASQVVQRLAGLPRDELEAVRDYEAGTRGRATILNRTSQLLAGGQG